MLKLPKYEVDNQCPKCGCGNGLIHRGPKGEGVSSQWVHRNDNNSYIRRDCGNCRYRWMEAPQDRAQA